MGVAATEVVRCDSFCDCTIARRDVFVVPDTLRDPRFVGAPLVVSPPHIRWYAGAPLIAPGGVAVGSLCVLDTRPRPTLTSEQATILVNLAGTVVELLEARLRHRRLAERTAEVTRLATLDPLTGLANRRALLDRLARALAAAASDRQVAMLCVDLDDFKGVNDSMGHPVGDRVLQLVAERLRRAVQPDDFVARLGGDEFAIVMCDLPDRQRPEATADRLIAQLRLPLRVEGRILRIGGCVGIAMASDAAVTPDDMLRDADVALYRAKQGGGCSYQLYVPDIAAFAAAS